MNQPSTDQPDRALQRDATPFWERPETVAWFAARPPDPRVLRVFGTFPKGARVLDLGCAAGRHAHALLELGLDAHALDASHAMVAHTRDRVAPLVGRAEAERRVTRGDMTDLTRYPNASFEGVVAIGILPGAASLDAWRTAVTEIARVLTPGGTLLLTHFTPPDGADGTLAAPLPDDPHRYHDPETGRTMLLLRAVELDAELARHGLTPHEPTRLAKATTMRGHRPVLDALVVKREHGSHGA